MAGASVKSTAELVGVAKSTVLKIMTAFEIEGKTSSLKQNSGIKRKLSDSGRRALTRIIWQDHKNTTPKITAKLEDPLKTAVSSKNVRRKLHKA